MASQITSVSIICSTACSGTDKIKKLMFRVAGLCEGNLPVTGHRSDMLTDRSHKIWTSLLHVNGCPGPWSKIVLPVWDEITYPFPNCNRKSHCGDKRVVNRLISKMGFPLLIRWHLYIIYERNPPVTGGFPSQMTSDAESVSMSWPHRVVYDM